MKKLLLCGVVSGLLCTAAMAAEPGTNGMAEPGKYANRYDLRRAETLAQRAADWRKGAIVYQVFVDRFAPPADLDAKRDLYPPPKRLRAWDDKPVRGEFVPEAGVWSHEIDFWGGDLASLADKLDYIQDLGADVVYLNPICQAYTNHKYDAENYFEISREYGTREDFRKLADKLHHRGMHLVLDGVFNHVGSKCQWFIDALGNPDSKWRDWFFIGDRYDKGYRAWFNVENLPELRMENPAVQARIFRDPDSVVQGYLRDGADGWRLDVAPDLGFNILGDLTLAAHTARPGSLVIGENWNYPEEWMPSLDAVLNFHFRQIILALAEGKMSGGHAGRMIAQAIDDAGLEAILRCWIVLDNHDTPRLRHQLPQQEARRFAQVLQFTLPGSPDLYYGVELGMDGGDDPEQRGPMRWDLVTDDNAELQWTRRLINMRRADRALKIGDFRLLDSEKLLAFERRTDRMAETTIVLANPTDKPVTEIVPVRESKFMNWQPLRDQLSDAQVSVICGTIEATVPPRTAWVLRAAFDNNEYDPNKRVQ